VCGDVRREWVCVPCAAHEVTRRRAIALRAYDARAHAESQYVHASRASQLAASKSDERERRRWKMEKMRHDIAHEQAQIQQGETHKQ
jgi:hypothetical protein